MANKLTKEEAKTKVYELTKQLAEIKKEKKAVNVDFKDRINDVESEIEAIIEEQEAQNTQGTAP
jgi:polyhydroxyalkanoate synthesis regulator phasin